MHGDEVIRTEAGVHTQELQEAPRHEPGAYPEHHREGYLGNDEHAPQPLGGGARHAASALAQRPLQLRPRSADGGPEAKEERGRQGNREREPEHGPVEPHRSAEQQLVGREREQERNSRPRHHQPRRAARQGEYQAFRQQLSEDPPAAGAEGGPDRHLALAHGGAREEQAGDVDARHEQDERHCP